MNVRIDKGFDIKIKKGEDEKVKKLPCNIYLQVFNALNKKNVLNVYPTTGNPDDDGYLAAAQFQSFISSQNDEQSFRDLYRLKMANPSYYSQARQIRLGFMINF